MLISLHLLSTGVRPGSLASLPANALLEILSPLQSSATRLGESAESLVHDYLDLVNTGKENRHLKLELAKVKAQRTRLVELEKENRRLAELLELRDALHLSAVGANVIGGDAVGLSRTLLLGQGRDSGIKLGMAVVSAEGVVGKIIAASQHASRVLLIDDHNSALDAFDQRSRVRAIIAGVVDDGLTMKYVGRTADVKPGDTIITSGLDGIFPRGLLVGKVGKVVRGTSGMFLKISVKPAVNFSNLEQVLVITQSPPKLASDTKAKG